MKTELKTEMNELVNRADDKIDSKIFTLLINTVAILGIFVAIAFAGFGISSIISNIDLTLAFSDQTNFVKSVFFLFLSSFLSYNLLLLLVYFIFGLSRPILTNVPLKDRKEDNAVSDTKQPIFTQALNLTLFYWIDGIVFVITIALFIWSILI